MGKELTPTTDELGLNHGNPLCQVGEVFGVPLLEARLVAVRPVGDAVSGDGIEQFVVQVQAARCVPFALQRDQPALPVFACQSFQSRKAASLITRRRLNSDRRY